MGSHTTRELERDTGFGRRTIAYYIQEGLLPRAGRRGPRTRYPELVRDRLLFIRRVREAEAEGEIRPVPLRDLRELFEALPAELIASVAGGDTPLTPDIVSLASAERRSMVDRVAALRERLMAERPGPTPRSPDYVVSEAESGYPDPTEPNDDPESTRVRLSWVLNRLGTEARRRRERAPEAVDTWSQIEVTSDIRLSVRGMAKEDAFLLRIAGRLLRQVLESGAPSTESDSGEPAE